MLLTDDEKREKWLNKLNQLKLTRSAVQKALVAVLSTAENPLSADEIREEVQRIRPQTGRATVFRYLDKLTSIGMLQRVHGYRNCSTYIPSLTSFEALLVCRQCGTVSELEPNLQDRIFSAIETASSDLEAHHITTYHLQLLGLCTPCQSK